MQDAPIYWQFTPLISSWMHLLHTHLCTIFYLEKDLKRMLLESIKMWSTDTGLDWMQSWSKLKSSDVSQKTRIWSQRLFGNRSYYHVMPGSTSWNLLWIKSSRPLSRKVSDWVSLSPTCHQYRTHRHCFFFQLFCAIFTNSATFRFIRLDPKPSGKICTWAIWLCFLVGQIYMPTHFF